MMKIPPCLIVVCALLLPLLGCAAPASNQQVAVNYMTIGPIYLIPYTLEKFNRERGEPARIEQNDPRLEQLLAMIETAELALFNDLRVRARLAFADGSVIYVDNWGGVRLPDREVRLEEGDVARAAALLASMTGVHALARHEKDWVQQAVLAHLKETESWAPVVAIHVTVAPRPEPDTLIAEVRHELDTTCKEPDYALVEPRYLKLYFDRASKTLLRKVRYQRNPDKSKPCLAVEESVAP